jgi:hypothetical protein
MTQNINKDPSPRFLCAVISLLVFLLVLIPLALSNSPKQAILGILVLILLFFFPGYLLTGLLRMSPGILRILISPVLGIVSVTTAYDVSARVSMGMYFPYLVVVFSGAGIALSLLHVRRSSASSHWSREDYETALTGAAVALCIAPLYWRSGRFSGSEYVFYGPAGQDPLFHVTLMQRLLHHVPPDNFIVSGLAAPVYHYFDDLTLAFIVVAQHSLHLGTTEIFDLYYRCYPTLLYFLLGALAYCLGRRWLGKASGGILSVLLLLGAGGLGWIFGVLRTMVHASHPDAMRIAALSEWSSWDGVDAILPIVHRPAHYHSLLICLAVMNVLLLPERTRRHWVAAGLLLGLMAGFNFTLAATFGIAAVLASFILWSERRRDEARDLGWLAFSLFMGSLPLTSAMLLSGFHNPAAGFPFRGPNLEFTTAMWGGTLGHMMPRTLVLLASLIVFPIVAYGIKLFGLGPLVQFDMGESRHRGIAMMFAIVFACSFVIGTFFPYNALGGVAIIFIQPTLWILGLFSLRPIHVWMERKRATVWPVALWGVFAVTWLQALGSFNFSHKAGFSQETAQALHDIRLASTPDQVVAFLPSDLIERPILGDGSQTTNFAITALTGMDGYFSSEAYTTSFAVSGLRGRDPAQVLAAAKQVYEQRRHDVESFLKGDTSDGASERLAKEHVCWIVVSGDAVPRSSSTAIPWRQTRDLTIYRLSQ